MADTELILNAIRSLDSKIGNVESNLQKVENKLSSVETSLRGDISKLDENIQRVETSLRGEMIEMADDVAHLHIDMTRQFVSLEERLKNEMQSIADNTAKKMQAEGYHALREDVASLNARVASNEATLELHSIAIKNISEKNRVA